MTRTIKARSLEFQRVCGKSARAFISGGHYSGKCPPCSFYFGAFYLGELVGAIGFRRPSLPKVASGYGVDIELARLYLLDEAGKNSESRFIGWSLRWLRKNTEYLKVISYADPLHGHEGTIYAAANFTYLGKEIGHGTRLLKVRGELVQAKTAYDRWGASGKNLEKVLGVPVEVINTPPKNVYVRELR